MLKIGKRTVAFSTTALVVDDEDAEVTFEVEEWTMRLVVSLHPEKGAEQSVEWEFENDGLRLRLNRWNNPLGTAFAQPANIGKSPSGKAIELFLYQHRIGNINRVDLQVTTGDQQ